jgi:VanZ family protein
MLHAQKGISMRFLFSILSLAYISAIFLLADSSVVSDLSPFNPYSLLHIPLYGILTVLLIFSFIPIVQLPNNLMTRLPNNLIPRLLIVGTISFIVAIADEIHQTYIPGRNASITDVLLDMAGITVVLFLFFRFLRPKHRLS